MKIAHATDIHLDHAWETAREVGKRFARDAGEADALLLTGDISIAGDEQASTLRQHLIDLLDGYGKPIYFVLGNHDIWGSRFDDVHRAVADLCAQEPDLVWLRKSPPIRLSEETVLTGHDGFYDAGHGNVRAGGVYMNDRNMIADFVGQLFSHHVEQLEELGTRNAAEARAQLRAGLAMAPHVVFATHVPPFPEACMFRGEPQGHEILPWYCNRATGDMLRVEAAAHPDQRVTVLSGHTHGAVKRSVGTIDVHVGAARYEVPMIAGIHDW